MLLGYLAARATMHGALSLMKGSLDGIFTAHSKLILGLFNPRAELTVHTFLVRLQNQPCLLCAIKSQLEPRL